MAVLLVLALLEATCKHICALCYALEKFCEIIIIKLLRSPQSCTSELQKWNQQRERKQESYPAKDITFIKCEYREKNRPHHQQLAIHDRCHFDQHQISRVGIQTLQHDLEKTGKKILCLPLRTVKAASADDDCAEACKMLVFSSYH